VAGRELAPEAAAADVAYMQKIARAAPKPFTGSALAEAPALRKGLADAAGADPWAPKLAQSP
jgi:hypothetical protein